MFYWLMERPPEKLMDVLEARKDLHSLIDPVWQAGIKTRDKIYEEMSNILGREAHISNMTIDDIKTCASFLIDRTKDSYPCHRCKHKICDRFCIPVCSKKVRRDKHDCTKFRPAKVI